MQKCKGFSLIELMVVIALLAIFVGIGIPSFNSMMNNNRSVALANELMTALNSARAEAIKRGKKVSVCPSTDGSSCAGATSWASGWIVFVDTAASDLAASPVVGTVLSQKTGVAVGAEFAGISSTDAAVANGMSFVRFTGLGTAPLVPSDSTSASGFKVKFNGCSGSGARAVKLSRSGRVSISRLSC